MSKIVYCLTNETGVFYIGATKNITTRLSDHKRRFGNDITLTTLSEMSEDWRAIELEQIRLAELKGVKLLNIESTAEQQYFCKYKRRRQS